jgi:hypothetical protein
MAEVMLRSNLIICCLSRIWITIKIKLLNDEYEVEK